MIHILSRVFAHVTTIGVCYLLSPFATPMSFILRDGSIYQDENEVVIGGCSKGILASVETRDYVQVLTCSLQMILLYFLRQT